MKEMSKVKNVDYRKHTNLFNELVYSRLSFFLSRYTRHMKAPMLLIDFIWNLDS